MPVPQYERSPLSLVDDMGTVFFAPDRILRAVHPGSAAMVEALLNSGLPGELATRGLMPATRKCEVTMPGYAFVLEHPRLPVVTYPFEWSYGMLRDAAALVLEINGLANAHGYELKDCHAYNVVFDGPRPCYVDLGSLTPRPAGAKGWQAREEFARAYDYPLRIWAEGGAFLARRLMASSSIMSHADHGLYRWPWLRWGGAGAYQRTVEQWYQYRQLSDVADDRIRKKIPPPWSRLVCGMKNHGWLPWQDAGLPRLKARVLRRRRKGPDSTWGDYQSGTAFAATPRFQRIIELVRQCGVESVIELAGNQGRVSEELLRTGAVKRALCTDADELAVDRAYERVRGTGGALHTAVLDFINPSTEPYCDPPTSRLRADAVLALAVSHHVLLTQRMPVERLLRSVAAYATSQVLVEFMPLGLWDGQKAPPVPDWYTLEWFRAAFTKEFELWHEEPVEKNRHLFCGRLRLRSLT